MLTYLCTTGTRLSRPFRAVTQGLNPTKANTAGQVKEKAEDQAKQPSLWLCLSKIHKRRD